MTFHLRYRTLPPKLKEAFIADTSSEALYAICEKYGVDDRHSSYIQLVGMVLLGFLNPNLLVRSIVEKENIDVETAKAIATDLAAAILLPVKAELVQLYGLAPKPAQEAQPKPSSFQSHQPPPPASTRPAVTVSQEIPPPPPLSALSQPTTESPLNIPPSVIDLSGKKPFTSSRAENFRGEPSLSELSAQLKEKESAQPPSSSETGRRSEIPKVPPITPPSSSVIDLSKIMTEKSNEQVPEPRLEGNIIDLKNPPTTSV